MAIFSAMRDEEKVAEFLIELALKREAMKEHGEWIRDFEDTMVASP
ncbi:MAG: hypothetical protein PSV40_02040 [Polaromonas sp.]|nr:hypothetical protein [Polaromonas sp.]MDI1267869.1 hypothetical protein [Polaromonas sp.]